MKREVWSIIAAVGSIIGPTAVLIVLLFRPQQHDLRDKLVGDTTGFEPEVAEAAIPKLTLDFLKDLKPKIDRLEGVDAEIEDLSREVSGLREDVSAVKRIIVELDETRPESQSKSNGQSKDVLLQQTEHIERLLTVLRKSMDSSRVRQLGEDLREIKESLGLTGSTTDSRKKPTEGATEPADLITTLEVILAQLEEIQGFVQQTRDIFAQIQARNEDIDRIRQTFREPRDNISRNGKGPGTKGTFREPRNNISRRRRQ